VFAKCIGESFDRSECGNGYLLARFAPHFDSLDSSLHFLVFSGLLFSSRRWRGAEPV